MIALSYSWTVFRQNQMEMGKVTATRIIENTLTRQLQLMLSMMLINTFNTPSQVLESSSDFSICLISVDMVLDICCLTRTGLDRTEISSVFQ